MTYDPRYQRLINRGGAAFERIYRLASDSLDLSVMAVYLESKQGLLRRAYASPDYPAPAPDEQRFVQALCAEQPRAVPDVRAHDELTVHDWSGSHQAFGGWACAPLRVREFDDPVGQLVIAARQAGVLGPSVYKTLDDLAALVVEQLEARYLHARMSQVDRMITIGTLAAGVAHEINNPLSFVGGNVQFALQLLEQQPEAVPDSVHEEVVAALHDALEGSRRVRDVVRDLHRLASGSNGDDFTVEPVSVAKALETSLNIARNHIEHRARLVADIDQMPPVMANESKLGQVFLNLLINAAQSIPRGNVAHNEVRVRATAADGMVSVSIADTGEGIDAEHLDHIFEPFFSTKPSEEGTGLGLAISQNIIATLGGEITVETTIGEGTTFCVRLPTAEAALPTPSGPRAGAGAPADDPADA
jgi:signal transduction histidine kinase